MPNEKPKIICLTPVKNEAWILPQFLAAASLWADVILVLDHQSEDNSRAIAASFPKVKLLDYPSREYEDAERRALLVAAAREIPGPRIIIALDADEFLSGEFFDELKEWMNEGLPPGRVIGFPRPYMLPGMQEAIRDLDPTWALYVDAGEPIAVRPMHGPRIPLPDDTTVRRVAQRTVMLHFNIANPSRNQSKFHWYQCVERLTYPRKRASAIFRLYHGFDRLVAEGKHEPIPDSWFDAYLKHGIDLRAINTEGGPWWWDRKVLEWFNEYGEERFAKLDIWDVDWDALAKIHGITPRRGRFADPRGPFTKFMHRWLRKSLDNPKRLDRLLLRGLVRPFGW